MVIKLGTLGGMLLAAHVFVIRRIERGQAAIRKHTSEEYAKISSEIASVFKRLNKKIKKKVSKTDCCHYRDTCPYGTKINNLVRDLEKDAKKQA